VAAYEAGSKSPTLATTFRLLAACGFGLSATRLSARHRPVSVPTEPPRLSRADAFRRGRLPAHLEWSNGKEWDLSHESDRRRVYAIVLREGSVLDVAAWVDVDLLVRDWRDIALPPRVRREWEEAFDRWGIEWQSPSSNAG
jgi:hypothetical protein